MPCSGWQLHGGRGNAPWHDRICKHDCKRGQVLRGKAWRCRLDGSPSATCWRREEEDPQEGGRSRGIGKDSQQGHSEEGTMADSIGEELAAVGDDVSLRERVERQERERWLKELRGIMDEAGLPAVRNAGSDVSINRIGKGRRPNTLRKHVKTWKRIRYWLRLAYDVVWPQTAEQFAFYLESMVSESCARTAPVSAYKTLMFLEFAGEVEEGNQLHRSPSVQNALEETKVALEKNVRERKQAHILPAAVVAGMETAVMDDQAQEYVRAYAWYRLIKTWAGLRFHDTQGVPNHTLEMTPEGLKGEIHRSKTSGPGKKVSILKFYVSTDAWIHCRDWLSAGWLIWNKMSLDSGMENRDFMLPYPNTNLDGFLRKVVDYATASIMSQALFHRLWLRKRAGKTTLLFSGVGTVWTEHSERATMRTWAQGARVPEDYRKQMGRWQASADEGYERAQRINTLESQASMARFVKQSVGGADPFDETAVLKAVMSVMEDQNYPEEARAEQATMLVCFKPSWVRSEGLQTPDWFELGDGMDERRVPLAEAAAHAVPVLSDDEDDELDEKASAEPTAGARAQMGHFIVSIVGRSQSRTLHRIGACHRQPGLHYNKFEVLGDEAPSTDQHHKVCKVCFPRGEVNAAAVDSSDAGSSGNVSSSDTEGSEDDWRLCSKQLALASSGGCRLSSAAQPSGWVVEVLGRIYLVGLAWCTLWYSPRVEIVRIEPCQGCDWRSLGSKQRVTP